MTPSALSSGVGIILVAEGDLGGQALHLGRQGSALVAELLQDQVRLGEPLAIPEQASGPADRPGVAIAHLDDGPEIFADRRIGAAVELRDLGQRERHARPGGSEQADLLQFGAGFDQGPAILGVVAKLVDQEQGVPVPPERAFLPLDPADLVQSRPRRRPIFDANGQVEEREPDVQVVGTQVGQTPPQPIGLDVLADPPFAIASSRSRVARPSSSNLPVSASSFARAAGASSPPALAQ